MKNVQDVLTPTALQEGMLFHALEAPGTGVYIDQKVVRLATLDVDAFRTAWTQLTKRHDALRTCFVWDGVDRPVQVVRATVELPLTVHEGPIDLDALLAADRAEGFELAQAPLHRHALIEGPNGWTWIWTSHHLIADGWSTQVLLTEYRALYAAALDGTRARLKPAFAFKKRIAAQAKVDEAAAEARWRDRLAHLDQPTPLPCPLPLERKGHQRTVVSLDVESTTRLTQAARSSGVTLNTLMLAAWALVLQQWSGQDEVMFGVTVAGRPSSLRGVARAVGLFINSLPLNVVVPADGPLEPWLRELQTRQLALVEDQLVPLPLVKRASGIDGNDDLFESLFVFESYPADDAPLDIDFHEQSNFPLAVLVVPGEALSIQFVHDTGRFPSAWIARVAAAMKLALDRLSVLDSDVSALHLATEPVLHGALASAPTRLAPDHLAHWATTTPNAVAVFANDGALTYAELHSQASSFAHRLVAAGIGPGQAVGLYLGRSTELMVALHAVLLTGACYVPLDPDYPVAHLERLVAADGIDVVVGPADAPELAPTRLTVDHDSTSESFPSRATADGVAYIIHTSGSTGEPKGVEITHANLAASTAARLHAYSEAPGTFLMLSSPSFDSSVAGLFWPLWTGGAVVLPKDGLQRDPDRLLDLARQHAVTHLLTLPTLYRLLLDAADGRLDALKVAIVAGEAATPEVFELHSRTLPSARLFNEYGPTETTVWATVQALDTPTAGPVPIGPPIPGVQIGLFAGARPVADGFMGEICVAGPTVARGYRGLPEQTAERFVDRVVDGTSLRFYRTGDLGSWRPDGSLDFHGRIDAQVKIRGHRIETAAIEAILNASLRVHESVVAGLPGPRGDLQLVAWVEPAEDFRIDEAFARDLVQRSLPAHQVPDRVVVLDALPRLVNGKVDRRSLPNPVVASSSSPAESAPTTEAEQTLHAIWCDVLVLDSIGLHENFFAIGGDSIASIRIASRARAAGLPLQVSAMFDNPTLAGLAASLASEEASVDEPAAPRRPAQPTVPDGLHRAVVFPLDGRAPRGLLTDVFGDGPPVDQASTVDDALCGDLAAGWRATQVDDALVIVADGRFVDGADLRHLAAHLDGRTPERIGLHVAAGDAVHVVPGLPAGPDRLVVPTLLEERRGGEAHARLTRMFKVDSVDLAAAALSRLRPGAVIAVAPPPGAAPAGLVTLTLPTTSDARSALLAVKEARRKPASSAGQATLVLDYGVSGVVQPVALASSVQTLVLAADRGLGVHWVLDAVDAAEARATITPLLDFLAELAELGVEPVIHSPSDFPALDIDQAALDGLVAALPRPHDIEWIAPLDDVQASMLVLQQQGRNDPGFIHVLVELEGDLDHGDFDAAWQDILAHHAAFRTLVHSPPTRRPVAVTYAHARVVIAEVPGPLDAFLDADRAAGIDLSLNPPLRLALVATGPNTWTLVWSCHHALLDGWSAGIALRQVMENYAARRAARPRPTVAPTHPRTLLRDTTPEADREAWIEDLRDWPTPLLPMQRTQTADYTPLDLALPYGLGDTLEALARRHGVTLHTVLQAGLGLALASLWGTDRALHGAVLSGRNDEARAEYVGLIANAVPVRTVVPSGSTGDWLKNVMTSSRALQARTSVPLSEIGEWIGHGKRRFFDCLLVFGDMPWDGAGPAADVGLRCGKFTSNVTSTFPLTLVLRSGAGLQGELRIDGSRVAHATGRQLIDRLHDAYSALADDPSASLGEPLWRDLGMESAPKSPVVEPQTSLEWLLTGLWKDVLGLETISVEDGFFELGGDSIQALDIFDRLRSELGRPLPLSLLLDASTIRELAVAIEAFDDVHWSAMVPLRLREGTKAPLFCVHAGGAEILFYRELAQAVDRSVYGFQPVGLDGRTPPLDSVPAMARAFNADLVASHPTGTVAVLGHCMGATIAYEMVRQLRAAGREAELFLVDAWPHAAYDMSRREGVLRWIRPTRPFRFARRVRERLTGRHDPSLPRNAVQKGFQKAQCWYRPPPLPGRAWFVRSSDFQGRESKQVVVDSVARLVEDLQIVHVESGHGDLFYGQSVVALGHHIDTVLEQR